MPRNAGLTAYNSGFSLIELMIVVAIVAILSAVAMPAYFNYTMRSRQAAVVAELMSIKAAEERFFAENSGYAPKLNTILNPDETDPAKFKYFYSPTEVYPNGDYRYHVVAGTIRAEGDLNGDGAFNDVWEVSIDNLSDKPKQTASGEGFGWSSLGNLF